jgi:tetratricopeptide (TPR) repeat protein
MTPSASALRDLVLDPGVIREDDPTSNRLIVWAQSGADDIFEHWERVATSPVAEIRFDPAFGGVATAALVPARRRKRTPFGQILWSLFAQKKARSFRLPDGRVVEQSGDRKTVLLVLSLDDGKEVSDDSIKSRWPEASRVRRLGPLLHLVENAEIKPASAAQALEPSTTSTVQPREQAERAVKASRASGDKAREATGLTDLGVASLNEGNLQKAANTLELALQIVQALGDRVAEYDILGHLGMVALAGRQPARAMEIFDRCLAYARTTGDPFAEKMTLERLGIAFSSVGDSRRALDHFDQALRIARAKGDKQQESNLLWFLAVQFAESGERDRAISTGEEAINISRSLGRPQTAVLGSYLQKYRMGLEDNPLTGGPEKRAQGLSPDAFLGGSIVTSMMATQSQTGNPTSQPSPPGLLKQALSATRAMANYVGSGFKSTPADLQRRRVETCAACEHHTGMRCRICGCFTEVKSRMLHEACPINKWPG